MEHTIHAATADAAPGGAVGVVESLEVLVAGRHVADRFDLAALLQACAHTGPSTKPLKTAPTPAEQAVLLDRCKVGGNQSYSCA